MIEFKNYDNAVIVSGDGDFRCLLEYLDQQNKLYKLIIPNQKKYSSLLIPFKKYMSFVNPLKEKLGRK
ncbi:NYN domain-containing protein [Patescibacteria group bacterium]|nr:NYN domain-containing protein [Patescibacteria group bacterium]